MKPRLFKSERVENELSLEMRQDKLGNMFYCVHFPKCELITLLSNPCRVFSILLSLTFNIDYYGISFVNG